MKRKAILFCFLSLTATVIDLVAGQAETKGSIDGYEHYDILKDKVDMQTIQIRSMDEYEAKVIDRDRQEVRRGCKTCRPWFIMFEVPGCSKC